MQSSFFVNMLALVDGQPRVHQFQRSARILYYLPSGKVITRRSKFELAGAEARAHILGGFKIALDNIDAVIKTIRESENAEVARKNLMTGFSFSEKQARLSWICNRAPGQSGTQKILEEYAAGP